MSKIDSRDGFKSSWGTVLALAGSAVGLGNIWRFPYIVGENGGAAFILMYILIILLVGIPAFMAEFSIGRSTQKNVFGAFKQLAPKTQWYQIGTLGIISCFLISGFYCVIGGWTMAFIYKSVGNEFSGMDGMQIMTLFDSFINNPVEPIVWVIAFIFVTTIILISGVGNGIEKFNKILMPMLIVIMIILVINSFTLPNFKEGYAFMFKPDFSKLNSDVFLNALGQAFFSMSLGMGTIITYGSYARKKDSTLKLSLTTAATDLTVAILAGMIIFPAVFSFDIPAEAGSQLAFITFPTIFQSMTGGYFFSILFFLLLFIAALTSMISIFEVIIAYLSEEFKMKRILATVLVSSTAIIVSSICSLSLISDSSLKIGDKSVFDFFDYLSASYMLPISGMLVVIYVGWFWSKKKNRDEISSGGLHKIQYFKVYMFLIKFVVPILILFILLSKLGIF